MASNRQYSRRTRSSKSVERPPIIDTQSDSEEQVGDATLSAPEQAATSPRASDTPAAARDSSPGISTDRAEGMDIEQERITTTPSRKRRRVRTSDARTPVARRGQSTDPATSSRPTPPRGTVDHSAGDDVETTDVSEIFRKLMKDSQPAAPALQEVDTEDLTQELMKRMKETEPATLEHHNARKRMRGYQAFSALCDAARELESQRAAAATASAPAVTQETQQLASAAHAVNSRSASAAFEMPYCRGRMPELMFPAEHDNGRIPVPTFDGKNWAAFKSVFESVAKHYGWTDPIKALRLKCCIKGEARAALGVVESIDWNYDQLVEHMELRHGRHKSKTEVMNELDKMYRKPGQSLTAWRDEVIGVANTGTLTEAQRKQLTHYSFLRGLSTYGQMQSWVGEHDKEETLASCYEWAKRFEREVGVPTYSAKPPVKVATHSAAAPVLTAEMVTTADAETSANGAIHHVEANQSENLADALASIKNKLNRLEKSAKFGKGKPRGKGWRFGNKTGGRFPNKPDENQSSSQQAANDNKQE